MSLEQAESRKECSSSRMAWAPCAKTAVELLTVSEFGSWKSWISPSLFTCARDICTVRRDKDTDLGRVVCVGDVARQ